MKKLMAGILAVSIWCTIASGCSWWEKEEPDTEAAATEISTEPQLPKDVAEMVAALEKTSALEAVRLNTKADVNLNGNLIAGKFVIDSKIEIENKTDEDNFSMKMETSTDMNGDVSSATSYYENGWYYTETGDGEKKEEKSSEEVLEEVTTLTDMVSLAAEKIENMVVTTEENDTVYTYTIPTYDTEKYFAQVIETLAEDYPDIAGATAEVEEIQLVSKVNQDGMLVQQELVMSGNVLQTIFKIPAEVAVMTTFEEMK